jgi:hypothetical protein
VHLRTPSRFLRPALDLLYPSGSGKGWKLSVCDQAILHLQAFTGGRYGENLQMHQNPQFSAFATRLRNQCEPQSPCFKALRSLAASALAASAYRLPGFSVPLLPKPQI